MSKASESTTSAPRLPAFQRAIIEDENGQPKLNSSVPLPTLAPGTVLIQTEAVALNPSDHKMGSTFPSPGSIIGMDFAGTIVSIHPQTTAEPPLRIGERVCGIVHGSHPTNKSSGAFANYVLARPELLLKLPSGMAIEEAATLGTGLSTNLLSLWHSAALGLSATPEQPAGKPFPVLVHRGSTATGTLAIQLLRLSGLDPIATCSARNFDLVRGYGASAVFDYMRLGKFA
jgi:NADPH:quinone reductase-like Zn-dependent oxidoreductase